MKQSSLNQLPSTVSTQIVTSTEGIPSDMEAVTKVLDNVADETIEKLDTQKGTEERLSISGNLIVDVNERNDCTVLVYVAILPLRLTY